MQFLFIWKYLYFTFILKVIFTRHWILEKCFSFNSLSIVPSSLASFFNFFYFLMEYQPSFLLTRDYNVPFFSGCFQHVMLNFGFQKLDYNMPRYGFLCNYYDRNLMSFLDLQVVFFLPSLGYTPPTYLFFCLVFFGPYVGPINYDIL